MVRGTVLIACATNEALKRYHLLDNLTVAENLDIPLSYRIVKLRDGWLEK